MWQNKGKIVCDETRVKLYVTRQGSNCMWQNKGKIVCDKTRVKLYVTKQG